MIETLARAHAEGRLVPVIGSGVSTFSADLPNWARLLDAAQRHLETLGVQQALVDSIGPWRDAGRLIDGFKHYQDLLPGDPEPHFRKIAYEAFLHEQFGDPNVRNAELLDALAGLQARVIVTTNYDTLLESHRVCASRTSETWLRPTKMRGALRVGGGVLHLHGRFDVPESVIMSRTDYERVVQSRDSEALAQAIFHSGVLLFVGMSLDGVKDPHLQALLAEFRRISDQRTIEPDPHVVLVRGKPSGKDHAELRRQGMVPLSYGRDYEDLPKFVRDLTARNVITIAAPPVRDLTFSLARSQSRQEHFRNIEGFIRDVIYPDRRIRVSYAELADGGIFGAELRSAFIEPANASHSTFHYPISIAGWALAEGRMIEWPVESETLCDLHRLDLLGRLSEVQTAIRSADPSHAPKVAKFVDLVNVRNRFESGTLALGDFFQNWHAHDPTRRYERFVSVPVPLLESVGNDTGRLAQRGTFNIDSIDDIPLLTPRTRPLLALASASAEAAYAIDLGHDRLHR